MNLYRKNDQNYDPVGTKLAQWSISSWYPEEIHSSKLSRLPLTFFFQNLQFKINCSLQIQVLIHVYWNTREGIFSILSWNSVAPRLLHWSAHVLPSLTSILLCIFGFQFKLCLKSPLFGRILILLLHFPDNQFIHMYIRAIHLRTWWRYDTYAPLYICKISRYQFWSSTRFAFRQIKSRQWCSDWKVSISQILDIKSWKKKPKQGAMKLNQIRRRIELHMYMSDSRTLISGIIDRIARTRRLVCFSLFCGL
jgi:hypothetical protein